MRKKLLSKLMLLLCALLVGSTSAWAEEVTYTFTSKSWAATLGDDTADWTSGKDGNQLQSGRGIQITSAVSGANATSPISFSNVSKIVVTYSTNASKGAGSIGITIGNNDQVSKEVTTTGGTTDRTLTYSFNPEQTGFIQLSVTCTTNSIYIKSIAITYTTGGGAEASPLASIAVDVTNATTVFHVGDEFTHEGAVVTATYEDESTADVTASATFSDPDMTTAGVNKTVTVSYTENEETKETTYQITVLEAATLASITLTGNVPTEFTQGDTFSSEGIKVVANYSDATSNDVTAEAEFSGYDMSVAGEQTVTVSYTENEVTKTATYNITVNAYVQPTEVTVNMNYEWLGSDNGKNLSSNQLPVVKKEDNITITITDGTSTCPRGDADYIRVYNGSTIKFEAPNGYNLTEILFTTGGKNTWNAPTYNAGSLSDKTWTGEAAEVTFTLSGTCFIASAKVTLEANTPKVLSSIALSGDYPTTFHQGDEFSHEGMTVTATYDTGNTKDVTANATFSGYDMSNTGEQTVTVSYTENEVTKTAEYNITVSAPVTLESIALSGDYPTEFIVGDEFSSTGLVVKATLSDESQVEVTDDVIFTGYDMNVEGEQTVTVSYTYKEVTKQATYQITVNPIPVKTIAEFIAAGGGKCYLIGTISNDKENKYGNYDLTDASGTIYVYGTLTAEGIAQQYKTMGIGDGDKVKVLAETYEYYNNTTHEAKNVRFIKKIVDVTISDALYATYVTASDVSFPDEVTAYVPTSVNGEYVHLEEILDAPKGTPVIVKADAAGTYELELDYAEVSDNVIANNLLKVSDGTITTTDATTVYALANKTNGVGFYRVKKDAENPVYVPAGKAYLEVATSNDVREFLAFTEGETNGIQTLSDSPLKGENIYSLSGQRVQKAQKGIYIVNGKKIMVK